jgi:hypothetical protein
MGGHPVSQIVTECDMCVCVCVCVCVCGGGQPENLVIFGHNLAAN